MYVSVSNEYLQHMFLFLMITDNIRFYGEVRKIISESSTVHSSILCVDRLDAISKGTP